MGNESSRPEVQEGRSRSLSPLPRDDPLSHDGADDLPPLPSTMPATLSTAFKGPGSPGAPGSFAWHRRRRRTHGLSPDTNRDRSRSTSPETRPLNATQPSRSEYRGPSPETGSHPATQPERSERKKSRSSKRKTKTKHLEPIITFEDFKKHRRRSAAPSPFLPPAIYQQLDESESALVLEDELPSQDESLNKASPSKKDNGKGNEAVQEFVPEETIAVAGPSMADLDDGAPPPSAQPLGKRSRRDSDSKAQKRRKTPRRLSGGSDNRLGAGPSDELPDRPVLEHINGDDLSADDAKAEPEHAADPLTTTRSQPTAFRGDNLYTRPVSSRLPAAGSQRSLSDSGYAEPDAQVPSGPKPSTGTDIPDGLPRYETDHHSPMDGPGSHVDDDSMSVQSAPHGLPAAFDTPFLLTAEHARDAQAPASTHDGPDFDAVDNLFSGNDEPAHWNNATSPDLALPRRDDEEMGNGKDEPTLEQHDANPAPTPPESSSKIPGLSRSAKRKAKKPFFPRQEEENAHAFAELPLEDVVSPPRPSRSTTAQPTAQDEAGPSTVAPRATRKRVKKKPTVDAADERSDGQIPDERSHYRSGPLSRTEQNQIVRAVDRFREDEDLTQEEIIRVIHDNPQTSTQAVNRQLWASIQDACPSRPRRKLIGWCRQRFHNFAGRGTWTQEQDDELADLVEKHGKKWSHIAGLINRHQKDVRDRWRNYLICRDNARTDVWSEGEEDRFRELVESSIEQIREGLSQNSSKSPEDLVNWLHVSDAMGRTRSRLQCMEKWKRMRAAEPLADKVPTVLPPGSSWRLEKARKEIRTLTADDKYVLMRAVRDSRAGTDAKINWKQIVSGTFGGRYERQTLVVTWGRLRKAVPDWEWKTTRDCAKYLCRMYESEGNFGATASGEVGKAEDDLLDDISVSASNRGRKGKAVVRSSADTATSASLDQTTDVSRPSKGKRVAPAAVKGNKSTSKTSREKRGKSKSKTGSDVEAPDTAREPADSADSADEDVEMEDQPPTKSRALSTKKRPRPAEREPSPEIENATQPLSPSVEAHAARSKRRERRESVGEMPSPEGKKREIPPSAAESTSAKAPKRLRRGSLTDGNVDSPLSKKQRSSKNHKVYGKAGKVRGDRGSNTFNGKSWSVISSDMDDMEDIPATLPTSSQVAH